MVGFEYKDEAERFWLELKERMEKFQLELHPEKTRLIEFGRHAAKNRKRAGLGKPETFDFLGFTHICGKTKKGRFMVLRQTIRKRMQAKLQEVKTELRRRMHDPVPEVGKWLKSVVGGHIRYFGVPGNRHALAHFRYTVSNLWHRALCRRSQHGRVKWERMKRLIRRWWRGMEGRGLAKGNLGQQNAFRTQRRQLRQVRWNKEAGESTDLECHCRATCPSRLSDLD